MTCEIYIPPIKNVVLAKNDNDSDVPEFASEFDTTFGRQITVRALNREDYTILELQENIDQIVYMEIILPVVAGTVPWTCRGCSRPQGMENSLGVISTTPREQHGKKFSSKDDEDGGMDVLKYSGRHGIFDCRHRRSLVAQIFKAFADGNGPHGCTHRRINVSMIV